VAQFFQDGLVKFSAMHGHGDCAGTGLKSAATGHGIHLLNIKTIASCNQSYVTRQLNCSDYVRIYLSNYCQHAPTATTNISLLLAGHVLAADDTLCILAWQQTTKQVQLVTRRSHFVLMVKSL
jgi:hypothetical protein